MNALMTVLLLTGAVTAAGADRSSSLELAAPKLAAENPFMMPTQAQSPRLAPTPMGSGFQSPWMQDTRYGPPVAAPVSPIAVLALVIVYATFLAVIVWAIVFQSLRWRHGGRQEISEGGDNHEESTATTDRTSRIDAWFGRNNTEERR